MKRLLCAVFLLSLIYVPLLVNSDSVRADYSGPQTPRDEKDSCCTLSQGTWTYKYPIWTGYDYDYKYAYNKGIITSFSWYPYPNPPGTFECPFVHIANVGYSYAVVLYTAEFPDDNPSSIGVQYNQDLSKGKWVTAPNDYYFNDDYIWMTSNGGSTDSFTADVIEFHYDDPSCQ